MVDAGSLNPVAEISIGAIGKGLLIFFGAVVVVILIGIVLWMYMQKRQLKYTIPLYKSVGGRTIRICTYRAKDFKIGRAGDKLWYVPKIKKYIIPATLQSAPHEYAHFERTDGEWINIEMPDIDEEMKKFGVKYIHQDMRSNRIAIADILDARFRDKKSWWEQYGSLVTFVIFYLVVAVAMVVIFYQWGEIVDRTAQLMDKLIQIEELVNKDTVGIIPASILLLIRRFKR